ncbi:uncharacterized protein LOC128230753 [Mya arenaria]|uniref:uncharacterized protein LOC128230753 n=1 Tax=Mya arenaria TaxID=6604 RepID=UPI0022E43A1C|nr:uncharacterized protein LOC128230753 [Mya arenaria]
MAAEMGLSPDRVETNTFPPEKGLNGSGGRVGLMERLRGRAGQHRSWTDIMKTLRLTQINDKRIQSNMTDKASIQTCLDKLHRAMKITTQQSLIERLDLISRQLGMLFTPPTMADINQVVLSAEMFKVIVIWEGQTLKDVKVSHQDTPTSCEELVEILSKGNFDEFISHLQGLLSIYSFNGDKKQKSKGYLALSNLEHDLNIIAQLQSSINGVTNYIHKSPLGILLPRRGGHPMKLIYYVSPYNLLCKKSKSSYPMTVEAITDNGLGHSVTVCLESSDNNNKLQIMPLTSVSKPNQDGKRLPSFQAVANYNSCLLAASFVLVLPEPVPVCSSVLDSIRSITGQGVVHDEETPFLSLFLQHCTKCKALNRPELFVTLPDQQHAYYLNGSTEGVLGGYGCLVRKIPFTHPTMVPKVLSLLRQQLVFNSVLSSVVRPQARKVYQSAVVFELMTLSLQHLSVMFEHPLQHSLITVEFDLRDITNVKCSMCTSTRDSSMCPEDYLSRVFQRSFSIPVTCRLIIKRVQEDIRKLTPPMLVPRPVVKPHLTWTPHRTIVKTVPNLVNMRQCISTMAMNPPSLPPSLASLPTLSSLPNPPPYPGTDSWSHGGPLSHHQQMPPKLELHKYIVGFNRPFEAPISESLTSGSVPILSGADDSMDVNRAPANPLLATLLDAGSPAVTELHNPPQNVVSDSPMLSKLLEENTSVATNPFPAPNNRKRPVKRKSSKDVTAGKSPKHRLSDSDMAERTNERVNSERHGQGIGEKHIDLDSSGGSYDEPVRPSSVNSIGSVGGPSSIIDLTDYGIGESHVKKLENSLDSIMGKESPNAGGFMNLGHPLNNQLSAMDFDHMAFLDFTPQNQNQNASLEGGGEFQPPSQWPSRQTPPTPNSRNSPHQGVVPKNEKISTSREDLSHGPRGRESDGPSSVCVRRNSQQKRLTLKQQRQNRNSVESCSGTISPDVFSPLMSSPGHHPLVSPGQFPISSPNYMVSHGSLPMMSPSHQPNMTSSNMTSPLMSPLLMHVKSEPISLDSKAGIMGPHTPVMRPNHAFGHVATSGGGKPSLSMLKAQLEQKNDLKCNISAMSQEKDELSNSSNNSSCSSQPSSVKLKRNYNHKFDSMSPTDSEEGKTRSSTFDFHSDDEDCDLPRVGKMTIVSASPTRLQITNKTTLARFNKFNKSEKFKRKQIEKELKSTLSVDSGKRKREKEDKKEKKRKKLNSSYTVENDIEGYKLTTVNVQGDMNGEQKPVMPKLKITKKGLKISVQNSLELREDNSCVKDGSLNDKDRTSVTKMEKDVVVKVEKLNRKSEHSKSERREKFKEGKDKERSTDKPCAPITRTPSNSDEGIFDRINAMKSENLPKNEDSNSSFKSATNSPSANHKKVSSSKSSKSHKRSSSASNSETKMKTPTLKLKPIALPTSSASSVTIPKSSGTGSNSKSISQSPTSTTIGKIGAVSLATSGSQKPLSSSSSKSPQGSGSSSSKTLSRSSSSGGLTSKSSSSLQKNIQIQGPSGKHSPNSTNSIGSKSSHSRSFSASSSNSKSDKLNKALSSNRTSSPLLDKEKSKSRSSSSSSRDREKSTSSKNSVPVPSATTQEPSASELLAFLKPKTNKIASFTIPKLKPETNANVQKVSTPTTTNASIVSMSASTAVTTTTTNSSPKFAKGSNSGASSVSSVSKGFNSSGANSGKNQVTSNSSSSNAKNSNPYNKSGQFQQNASRPQNLNVSNAQNTNNRGNNSPNSYSKGNNPGYKGNNQNNQSPGFRNHNSGNAFHNKTPSTNNGPTHSNWNNSNTVGNSKSNQANSNSHQNNFQRGNNTKVSSDSGNRQSNSSNPNTSIRSSATAPNAPKGPGPPNNSKKQPDPNKQQQKHGGHSPGSASRGRKGSLSAVIDKLTCKVSSGPVISSESSANPPCRSAQKSEQVIVDESPASPEMDAPIAELKPPEKVVVITEAPESPEMETPTSPVLNDCGSTSASKIVSIPLEIDASSSNYPDFSACETDPDVGDNEVLNNLNSNLPVPKTIPLDSVNAEEHVTSGQVKMVNSVSQQNGDVGNHHGDDEKFKSTNDLCNKSDNTKDTAFKVTTPKMHDSAGSKLSEDNENWAIRRKSRCSSKSSDINSPVSSPENGLIIDIDSSPTKIPKSHLNSPTVSDSGSDFNRSSPALLKSPGIKTMPLKFKGSQTNSPLNRENSTGTGSNANSPGYLEDDLMDEALGIGC